MFNQFVDSKMTRKILAQARKQQADLEEEYGLTSSSQGHKKDKKTIRLRKTEDSDDDGNGEDDLGEEEGEDVDESYYDDIKVDEEDERALELFMSKDEPKRK